jgi:hypothetical protein
MPDYYIALLWAMVFHGDIKVHQVRKHKTIEASESHPVKADRRVALAGQTVLSKTGTITSYSIYLSGNMDGKNNCKVWIMKFPDGKTLGWRTAQAIYKITLKEEFAKMNKLTGTMFSSSLKTKASDKSMVPSFRVRIVGLSSDGGAAV